MGLNQGFIRRQIPVFARRAITMIPALIVIAVGFDPTRALVAAALGTVVIVTLNVYLLVTGAETGLGLVRFAGVRGT